MSNPTEAVSIDETTAAAATTPASELPPADDTKAQPVDIDSAVSEAPPASEPTNDETVVSDADDTEADGIPGLDDEQAEADNDTTDREEKHAAITEEALASIKALIGKEPVEVELGIQRIHDDTKLTKGTIKKQLEAMTPRKNDAEQPTDADAEPWADDVDGEALADDIERTINKYIHLAGNESPQLTLWIFMSYLVDRLNIMPKLALNSPIKRCGKTTLLELLEAFCCNAKAVSNISPAAVFRWIEQIAPTLMIDEVDTFITKDNPELVGIINAGHKRRTATVARVVGQGDDMHVEEFNVFTPMVVAGIGAKPDTVEDRSIMIRMERPTNKRKLPRIPFNFFEDSQQARLKLAKFADDIEFEWVEAPPCENARNQDNWSVLFSIARLISQAWVDKCQLAYDAENRIDMTEVSVSEELLADIEQVFIEAKLGAVKPKEPVRLKSIALLERLCAIDDRPWSTWNRGNPISPSRVAQLLKGFSIKPMPIKIDGKTQRGYSSDMFDAAFASYLHHDDKQPDGEQPAEVTIS